MKDYIFLKILESIRKIYQYIVVTFYNSMKCFIDVCFKLICNPCKYVWNKYEYEIDESTFMIVCKYM